MRIQIYQGKAFVHVGNGQMLCIGTRKEVAYRPDPELAKMFFKAMAIGQFNDIKFTGTQTAH